MFHQNSNFLGEIWCGLVKYLAGAFSLTALPLYYNGVPCLLVVDSPKIDQQVMLSLASAHISEISTRNQRVSRVPSVELMILEM